MAVGEGRRCNIDDEEIPPRVSIGLPVYNGEAFLEEAISSILSQSFRDFELIISDNASTDRTEAICRRFAAQDRRIRYSRNSRNIGGMSNANLTFSKARGVYFRLAAADDVCAPTLVERLVRELDGAPEVAVCVSATIQINATGNVLPRFNAGVDDHGVRYASEGLAARPHDRFRQIISTRHPCDATYGLIRSDVLRDTYLLQDFTASDYVLLAELAVRGPFRLVPEPLFFKRWHDGNEYRDWRGRMAWSRPTLFTTGRPSFPNWLMLAGLIRAVRRAPLERTERLRCLASVGRWAIRRSRGLAWDVAFAGIMLLHSSDWRRAQYAVERWA
jgi:glycosyltransferase involved in cell wall biosynthesis